MKGNSFDTIGSLARTLQLRHCRLCFSAVPLRVQPVWKSRPLGSDCYTVEQEKLIVNGRRRKLCDEKGMLQLKKEAERKKQAKRRKK